MNYNVKYSGDCTSSGYFTVPNNRYGTYTCTIINTYVPPSDQTSGGSSTTSTSSTSGSTSSIVSDSHGAGICNNNCAAGQIEISGLNTFDSNNNRIFDSFENGINGVRINLYKNGSGQFYVQYNMGGILNFSPPNIGSDLIDSDVTYAAGHTSPFSVGSSNKRCDIGALASNKPYDPPATLVAGSPSGSWSLVGSTYSGHRPGTPSDDGWFQFCVDPEPVPTPTPEPTPIPNSCPSILSCSDNETCTRGVDCNQVSDFVCIRKDPGETIDSAVTPAEYFSIANVADSTPGCACGSGYDCHQVTFSSNDVPAGTYSPDVVATDGQCAKADNTCGQWIVNEPVVATPTPTATAEPTATATATPQIIDLTVEKSVDNQYPAAGGNVIWTIKATNNGPDNATGVNYYDSLPSGVTYVSNTTSQGAYNPTSNVWSVGNLAVGASATLTLTSSVDSPFSSPITNIAYVGNSQTNPDGSANNASSQGDSNPGNNEDSATIYPGEAKLCVIKVVEGGPLWPSEFTIGIKKIDGNTVTMPVQGVGPQQCAEISDLGGTYMAFEEQQEGYDMVINGECNQNGFFVTPNNGETLTCIITNTYNPDATPVPTATATQTAVPTATATQTAVPTATATQTAVPTATATQTAVPTATETAVQTPNPTETAVETPSPTQTAVPTATATQTAVPTATETAVQTPNPTETAVETPNPTATATQTAVAPEGVNLCVQKVVIGSDLPADSFDIGIYAAGVDLPLDDKDGKKCKYAKIGDWVFSAYEDNIPAGANVSFGGDCDAQGTFSQNYASGTLTCVITNTFSPNPTPNPTAEPTPTPTSTATPPDFCQMYPTHPGCNSGGTADRAYTVQVCECGEYSRWQNQCGTIMLDKREVEQCAKDTSLTDRQCAEQMAAEQGHEVCNIPSECESCTYKKTKNQTQLVRRPPTRIVPAPVPPMPARDPDNFHQTVIIPQTGPISQKMMQEYGAASPFADLSLGDEDFFATLALYLQGVLETNANGGYTGAYDPLTGDYVEQLLEKATGYELGVTTTDIINYGQARASIEHVLNASSYRANALTDDLGDKSPDTSITRGDFHDLLFRALSADDTASGRFVSEIKMDMPSIGIENLYAERVLLSQPDGWLEQLQDGAGFYVDSRPGQSDRVVLFGHSSRYNWNSDTNIGFKPLIDADVVGQTLNLTLSGEAKTYRITSKEMVNEYDVASLRDVDANEDLTIFTCDTDIDARWIYHAEEI